MKYRKNKLAFFCLYRGKQECESLRVWILHIAYCSGSFSKNSDNINVVAFHYAIWEIVDINFKIFSWVAWVVARCFLKEQTMRINKKRGGE